MTAVDLIREYLKANGPSSKAQIRDGTSLSDETVRSALVGMRRRGGQVKVTLQPRNSQQVGGHLGVWELIERPAPSPVTPVVDVRALEKRSRLVSAALLSRTPLEVAWA